MSACASPSRRGTGLPQRLRWALALTGALLTGGGCAEDGDPSEPGGDTAAPAPMDATAPDAAPEGPAGDAEGDASRDTAAPELDAADVGDDGQEPVAQPIDCAALDCDDGSACTVDACDPGVGCVHWPLTCADSDPCTIDACDPVGGCTFTPYSCDDGEDCTEDICYGNGLCKNIAAQCDDANLCTIDLCADGQCAYLAVECDDGDPCTVDVCLPQVGCTVDPEVSACCEVDAECHDGNACTVNTCEGGLCVKAIAEPGVCCLSDGDCPGGSPCQAAFCANYTCELVGLPGEGCCDSAGDCDDGDPCTEGACEANQCVFEDVCCSSDEDCPGGGDACVDPRCLAGQHCVGAATLEPGCCAPELYSHDFEGGALGGFTFVNDSDFTGVGWKVLPSAKAQSGVWVLYYGNPVTQSYSTGSAPNSGVAYSPPVALPAGVRSRLQFKLRMETELGTYSDRLLVRLVQVQGGVPAPSGILIWTKKGFFTKNQWVTVSVPLWAWSGETVRFEFDFDTFDAAPVVGEGVFIDDIQVTSDCGPLVCQVDADCQDALFSTVSECVEGHCVFAPSPANCEVHADCNDHNPCTSDICGDYVCYNVAQSWCCNTDEDCVDAFACTTDKCILTASTPFCSHNWQPNCCDMDATGKLLFCDDNNPCTLDSCPHPGEPCQHVPIAGCCQTAADCDDSDACTVDLCDSGSCVHLDFCCANDDDCDDGDDLCTAQGCMQGQCSYVYLGGDACCQEALLEEDFGSPVSALVPVVAPAVGQAGWQISSAESRSAGAAMWFGDLATGTYDVPGQAVGGVLKTHSPLPVPTLTFTTLSFWVWMGTEYAFGAYPNADFDRLVVRLQPLNPLSLVAVGPPAVLWDSGWGTPTWWLAGEDGSPAGPAWTEVSGLDLTPWAGSPVHLFFEFDSKDAFNNDFPGVFLDDVRVERLCGVVAPK